MEIINSNPYDSRKSRPSANVAKSIMSQNPTKVLLVEGTMDEWFYGKIIETNKKTINVIIITKTEKEDVNKEDKKFFAGKNGNVDAKKAIIIRVAEQFKNNDFRFYGIVDKDYDNTNKDVKNIQIKYGVDILSANHIISTETNDVETLIFKYDMDNIKNIPPQNCTKNEWVQLLDKAIRKSCKLGFIRKKSRNGIKKLKFKTVFNQADSFKSYAIDNDSDDIKNAVKKILIYREDEFQYWLNGIPSDFSNIKWDLCRGHDLTGLIASLMFINKYSYNENLKGDDSHMIKSNEQSFISKIKGEETKDYVNSIDISKFQTSNVYQFILSI